MRPPCLTRHKRKEDERKEFWQCAHNPINLSYCYRVDLIWRGSYDVRVKLSIEKTFIASACVSIKKNYKRRENSEQMFVKWMTVLQNHSGFFFFGIRISRNQNFIQKCSTLYLGNFLYGIISAKVPCMHVHVYVHNCLNRYEE